MTIARHCPLCTSLITLSDTTFLCPVIPKTFDFPFCGTAHRKCLLKLERVQEYRSALRSSILSFIDETEDNVLVLHEKGNIVAYHKPSKMYKVWNLQDFAQFCIIEEAMERIYEAVIEIHPKITITQRVPNKLEFHENKSILHTISNPLEMENLLLKDLQKIKKR